MQDGAQSAVSPTAMEEVLGLFREPPAAAQSTMGYVDLLGEKRIGTTLVQKTMERKTFARIYERFWRPRAGRGFFGRGGPNLDAERQITIGLLRLSAGDRVLDVGCGPGTFTRHLAEANGGGLVVGLDPSRPMVARAVDRPRQANVAYVRGDACALPFRDEEFDALCCTGVIHAIDDPMEALDEMTRVLRRGGRIALMATCAAEDGSSRRIPKGIKVFQRGELTGALAERGMEDIVQIVIGQAQILSARKAGGPDATRA
jgi:SAM-dependent methyltransferase